MSFGAAAQHFSESDSKREQPLLEHEKRAGPIRVGSDPGQQTTKSMSTYAPRGDKSTAPTGRKAASQTCKDSRDQLQGEESNRHPSPGFVAGHGSGLGSKSLGWGVKPTVFTTLETQIRAVVAWLAEPAVEIELQGVACSLRGGPA